MLAVLTVALAALAPAKASAQPGDVFVADRDADAIWKLGPGGGDATPLAQGSPPFGGSPYGMTLGPDGLLYVADELGAIFKVNRTSGHVTQLTTAPLDNPIDTAFDARGRLFTVEFASDDIHIVNRATGSLTPYFDGPSGGFNSLAIKRDGTIFISDEDEDEVYRLTTGGVLTPIISGDPDLSGPDGIMLSPDERYLYVGSFSVPRFFRYELRTGEVRKFEIGVEPYSFALLPSNRLLFSDDTNTDLATVSRLGGTTTPFSSDPDFVDPRDIVIEPRRCAGRIPTIVGTNRRDVIRGSRFADVISTLGGRDLVRGLGGRDIVCAGAARDTVFGGKGNDRLIGQGGPDRLYGQRGRDRLIGKAGRDLLVGGRGNDRCLGGGGRDRTLRC